jgi:hypothetical protein
MRACVRACARVCACAHVHSRQCARAQVVHPEEDRVLTIRENARCQVRVCVCVCVRMCVCVCVWNA